MKTSRILFAALLVLPSVMSYGQDITVTGNITDASDGTGVPYASVHLKGSMTGVSADAQGAADGCALPSSWTFVGDY